MPALRLVTLLLALTLSACLGGGRSTSPVFSDPGASVDTLLNAYRAQVGLNSLSAHPKLKASAMAHARDMAAENFLSHAGSDGSSHTVRATRAGYGIYVSENVAAGQKSTLAVMKGFIGSRGHRKNLQMDPAEHYGFAHATAPGTKYKNFWVLVIGHPPPPEKVVAQKVVAAKPAVRKQVQNSSSSAVGNAVGAVSDLLSKLNPF